jgi:hypothetical protein
MPRTQCSIAQREGSMAAVPALPYRKEFFAVSRTALWAVEDIGDR